VLYLDTSAIIKRYLREPGTDALNKRFQRGDRLFTSPLTYAEVLSVLGRKRQQGGIDEASYRRSCERFVSDWRFALNVLELNTKTMADLPGLTRRFRLRGADAVHLSSACWLRDMCLVSPEFAQGEPQVEFAVSDIRLARIASSCDLAVFDPEAV